MKAFKAKTVKAIKSQLKILRSRLNYISIGLLPSRWHLLPLLSRNHLLGGLLSVESRYIQYF